MDDLVKFLRARLDEDEQIARAAGRATGGDGPDDEATIHYADAQEAVAEHMARHDPARVLAEVDAKRLTAQEHEIRDGRCRVCAAHAHENWTRFRAPCFTLRLLALPYADHDAYREEWRP